MTDRIEAECLGVRLCRVDPDSYYPKPAEGPQRDRWRALWDTTTNSDWDGPSDAATLDEWPERIRAWRIAKQVDAGFRVWIIKDDRPEYWREADAVYRTGVPSGHPGHYREPVYTVHCRNGRHEPDNFWATEMAHCAPVTPDVAAAIEETRRLHKAAVEAAKAWRAAWKAIPRLQKDEFHRLPIKPGAEGWEGPKE